METGLAEPRSPSPNRIVTGGEGLDAVVLLARPGIVSETWTREGVERDMVGVMAATLADIVDRLNEAFGGAPPRQVSFLLEDRRIVVERMPGSAILILAAAAGVPVSLLRRSAQAVRDRLAAKLVSPAR